MTTRQFQYLKLWAPGLGASAFDDGRNYMGHQVDGYLVYTVTRDSDLLEQSNYETILKRLNAVKTEERDDQEEPYVQVHGFNHWACGWLDQIIISSDAPAELLDLAESLLEQIANYPVLDEDDYCNRQCDAVFEYWRSCSLQERVELCSEHGDSIFAARRVDQVPEHVSDRLFDSEITY